MGFLATIVEFLRSEVNGAPTPEAKVDRGGDDTVTGYHFAPPGDDAQPLPGDVAYLGDDLGAGNAQILGYQDPKNAGVAGKGERRLYARSADGASINQIWLKADGSVLVSNDQGSIELGADGTITVQNGQASAEIAPDGAVALANGQATAQLGSDGSCSLSNSLGGVDVDASGNVTFTTPLGTFGAGTHMHISPFGPTGAPIPGT